MTTALEVIDNIKCLFNDFNPKQVEYDKCKNRIKNCDRIITSEMKSKEDAEMRLKRRYFDLDEKYITDCIGNIEKFEILKQKFEKHMEDLECKICFSACSLSFGKCKVCKDCSICASCEKEQVEKFKVCPFCKTKF